MSAGFLRDGVEVRDDLGDGSVFLRHGFWETRLPRDWVAATPGFRAFLARRGSIADVAPVSGVEGVRMLLGAQGCLTEREPTEPIALGELRVRFAQLCSGAYGRYYRHPAWERVRTGDRGPVVAWLLHNHQLSRSVGQTAARAAARSTSARAREVFLRNAIEEYDHFDRFFRLRCPVLGLSPRAFAAAVPSPATLSFTLSMLSMAEEDWIAHALVAWFQERTERFAEEARVFYDGVERATGLEGIFAPWLAHVDYDRSSRHADAFGELLDGPRRVGPKALSRALRRASFAVHHLLGALDEIAAAPTDGPVLRAPPGWPAVGCSVLEARDLSALAREMEAAAAPAQVASVHRDDTDWLSSAIRRAATLALGHAERDEEILSCGAVVEALAGLGAGAATAMVPRTPACAAVGGFLREASLRPLRFCAALRLVLPCLGVDDVAALLDRRLASVAVSDAERDAVRVELVQLSELIAAWRREQAAPPVDVFVW